MPSPCTALGIIGSYKMTELPKTLLLARPSLTSMRHYTEGLKYPRVAQRPAVERAV